MTNVWQDRLPSSLKRAELRMLSLWALMQSKPHAGNYFGRFWAMLAIMLCGFVAPLRAQTLDSFFNPSADYNVTTLAVQSDGRILVGGSFGALGGQPCSSLGRLDENGTLDTSFNAGASGLVICLAIQPDGGIVAGGSFSTLGGQTRSSLGRLYANGTLDLSFNPGANGAVRCLALQADGKILVAGTFSTLGGQTRSCIGRLNTDGTLDATFNPGANNEVYALAVQADGKILVGGVFSTLGGQARNYLGRLQANGTLDSTFNPGADSTILSLAVQGDDKILVGGFFMTLGGQTRTRLGRLNSNGTLDTTFADLGIGPSAMNVAPYSLVVQADGKILAGGLFDTVGGLTRNSIVRLNASGTVDTTFASDASYTVYALAVQVDGRILAAGQFTTLGGQPRQYIGRLNNTGPATQVLAFDGSSVTWLRGDTSPEVWRTTFDGSTNGTAWVSLGAGQRVADGWQLNGLTFPTNASIRARGFAAGGNDNGSSSIVETLTGPLAITQQPLSRTNNAGTMASFRMLAGGAPPLSYQWQKDGSNLSDGGIVSGVQTPTLMLSNVFGADAGGYSVIVSNASGSLTSLVATLGVIDPFIASQPANRVANSGQTATFSVTAGGTAPLNYQWRKDDAELTGATATSLTLTNIQWSDRGNYDVKVSNGLNSVTSAVASLAVNLAPPDSFNPGANGNVVALAVQTDGGILVGGKFTTLGGQTRNHLGRINGSGTLDTNFNVGTTGGSYPAVSALAVQADGKVLVGGDFTTLGGQAHTNLGRLKADGTLDSSFSPVATAVSYPSVAALAVQRDGKILVGGHFTSLAGQPRTCIGRLTADGALDGAFNPLLGGVSDPSLYSLAVQPDGKILVGGSFTTLNGQPRNHIGRLNADGGLDTTFNPGVSLSALCFAIQADGNILVGGNFTSLGGQTRYNIGRLNTNGTLDASFNPGAGSTVSSLAVQSDGKILAAGAFTTLAGQNCYFLGRLNLDGTLDPTFNPGANSSVSSIAIQANGQILVGGGFFILGGQLRYYFGRLNNSEPATEHLIYDGSNVTWLRGGTSPEVWGTRFEICSDGSNWVNWGQGTRVSGGWRLESVPSAMTNTSLRARGFVRGGYDNGSDWFVESTLSIVPRTPPQIILNDRWFGVVSNKFGFNLAGFSGQIVIVEASTNLLDWIPLQTNSIGGMPCYFSESDSMLFPRRFYRAKLQ